MPLKNLAKQCKAKSKATGERCQNPAVTDYEVCYVHGANPKNRGGRKKGCKKPENSGGRPIGNSNAKKHGAYSPRLSPDEQPIYEHFVTEYLEDVPNAFARVQACPSRRGKAAVAIRGGRSREFRTLHVWRGLRATDSGRTPND
jgi:hypothetical protein